MAGAEKARDAIAVPVQHALRLLLFNLCPSSPELVPEENLLHPWEPQPAGCSGAARSILTLLQALVHSDGYLVHQGDEAGEKSGCEGAWPRSWGCRAPGKDVFCTPRRTLEPILENKPLGKGQRCAVGHRAGAEVPRQLLDRPNTATPIKAPPGSSLSRRSRALPLCRGCCWSRVARGSPSLQGHGQTTLQGTSAFHYTLEQALACCLAAPGTQSPHGPVARCWLPHTAGTPWHPSKCHQAQKRPVHPDSPRRSTIFNGNKSPGWDLLPAAVPCEVKQKKENKNDRGRRAQAPSLAPQRESSHQD
ncbi:uncharacterized protein [Anas platyrhynchos]|uniref:uncharacterized protein n=1 Tax=Anas platyrhynchos TaxID=8839 RepID=UPI003AF2BF83